MPEEIIDGEPRCLDCRYYTFGVTCEAFPVGIPEKIWGGELDHTKPFPGDNGIRFEKVKPDED